jgi:hypothetical protein
VDGGSHRGRRDLGVTGGGAEAAVAEQELDSAEISTGLEPRRSTAVSSRLGGDLFAKTGGAASTQTHILLENEFSNSLLRRRARNCPDKGYQLTGGVGLVFYVWWVLVWGDTYSMASNSYKTWNPDFGRSSHWIFCARKFKRNGWCYWFFFRVYSGMAGNK